MATENKKIAVWAPPEHDKNQLVVSKNTPFGHQQKEMFSLAENEMDGVEMGVLNDGTPYLTQRGLSTLCGTPHSVIGRLSANWLRQRNDPKGRAKEIHQILLSQDLNLDSLYISVKGKFSEIHAYPDYVCMAVLEYYAFTVGHDKAKYNHRILARQSLRHVIYSACKYDPRSEEAVAWENFRERLLLNEQLPKGYFSIFKEIADFVLRMIKNRYPFDQKNILDISVGLRWGNFWRINDYDAIFGRRKQQPHYYPDWYPQSEANPVDSWIYPNSALAAFREWLDETYIPKALPVYIAEKIKKGDIPQISGANMIKALTR